jgi:NAD(P)-dependent dehydrogenase (short-subunit alcohol dehydrogenase family)
LQDPTKPELALNEKVVLITGGGRGIGVSIVEAFAKARAKTIILTGRSEAGLANTKNSLESSYPETTFIPISVDIGSEESVDNLYKSLKGKVDHIGTFRDQSRNDLDLNVYQDVLVNNAGVLNEFGPKVGETSMDKFWADMVSLFCQ